MLLCACSIQTIEDADNLKIAKSGTGSKSMSCSGLIFIGEHGITERCSCMLSALASMVFIMVFIMALAGG